MTIANTHDAVAKTRDGTSISYAVTGSDTMRRVALVHSLAMDKHFWRPVAERLARDASVLTLDCRGHGASDKPPGPYSVEQFADDLADLLHAAGWPSVVVAGASMGGSVALAFAGKYPQRTLGLGLFDTTAWYGPDAPKQWAERADRAISNGLASLIDFQKTRWFGDAFREKHPDVVEECVSVFLNNDPKAYAESCRMLGSFDLRATLPHLTMPVAVAVGEEDYATPIAMAQQMHDGIRGSTLNIIRGGRHLTPLEHPSVIADEIKALMERAKT